MGFQEAGSWQLGVSPSSSSWVSCGEGSDLEQALQPAAAVCSPDPKCVQTGLALAEGHWQSAVAFHTCPVMACGTEPSWTTAWGAS